ncbi:MAG: FAD-binding domain-containing protein [Myxococcota bacterium]
MGTQLVWFKRDLRIDDHAPLLEAAAAGSVVCLYIYEPELLAAPETDSSHLEFIEQSLRELDAALVGRGGRLVTRHGEAVEVLDRLHDELGFERLWSHEETGLGITYARDRRVKQWCRRRGVEWIERPQCGVVRPLKARDGWARRWQARMQAPLCPAPLRIEGISVDGEGILGPVELGRPASVRTGAQRGGRAEGLRRLDDFLQHRGRDYRWALSSPLRAWDGCSRLSPHLAFGTLSVREVAQHTWRRQRRVALEEERARALRRPELPALRDWAASLDAFGERLRWRDHFIQKLESQPSLEHRNLHPACDGLRIEDPNDWTPEQRRRFVAFEAGATGYPMVDACMRCLQATGWINFRMRAMLASFAAYHLWLHWRPTAQLLARRFLDFEPGIHYPQIQMQSGTTGINALRIYDPAKQVLDHDPRGEFIRRWVPELEGVPDEYLPRPERMPASVQQARGCVIGRDYGPPIVDPVRAPAQARRRLEDARRSPQARAQRERIHQRHGSRRPPATRSWSSRRGGPRT